MNGGEPTAPHKWTGWSSRLQETYHKFKRNLWNVPQINKEIRKITTCNLLDLETLGFSAIMPTNLPGHWHDLVQKAVLTHLNYHTNHAVCTTWMKEVNSSLWGHNLWMPNPTLNQHLHWFLPGFLGINYAQLIKYFCRDEGACDFGVRIHNGGDAVIRGDFWAWLVDILVVFPSPTGYMSTSFTFFFMKPGYLLQIPPKISWSLELPPVTFIGGDVS